MFETPEEKNRNQFFEGESIMKQDDLIIAYKQKFTILNGYYWEVGKEINPTLNDSRYAFRLSLYEYALSRDAYGWVIF